MRSQFHAYLLTSCYLFIYFNSRSILVCSVSSLVPTPLAVLTSHTGEVNAVCWSPGGQFIASCSDDCHAKIWNIHGLVHDLRGHEKEIYTVRWTPTGPGSNEPEKPLLLCSASFDGCVKVLTLCLSGSATPYFSCRFGARSMDR